LNYEYGRESERTRGRARSLRLNVEDGRGLAR